MKTTLGNPSDNSRTLSLQETSMPDWADGISVTPDALDGNCETVCVSLGAAQKIWIQSAEESDCCWDSKHTSCVVQDDVTAKCKQDTGHCKGLSVFCE